MSKISINKVQDAFNSAIRRRDCRCMVRDFEPCYGSLEASHFYTVGGNPALRFYPPNAWTQCSKHHWNHHNKSAKTYVLWMQENKAKELEYMQSARSRYIKYDDETKAEIMRLCDEDRLDELQRMIEVKLGVRGAAQETVCGEICP